MGKDIFILLMYSIRIVVFIHKYIYYRVYTHQSAPQGVLKGRQRRMTPELAQRSALSVPYEPGKTIEFVVRLIPVEMVGMRNENIVATGEPEGEPMPEMSGTSPVVESQHVGNIGERLILRLKVLKMKAFRNATSTSYRYEFRDAQGNQYQWVTYRDKRFHEGQWYDLRCTISKFYERRGVQVTGITRCRSV